MLIFLCICFPAELNVLLSGFMTQEVTFNFEFKLFVLSNPYYVAMHPVILIQNVFAPSYQYLDNWLLLS